MNNLINEVSANILVGRCLLKEIPIWGEARGNPFQIAYGRMIMHSYNFEPMIKLSFKHNFLYSLQMVVVSIYVKNIEDTNGTPNTQTFYY